MQDGSHVFRQSVHRLPVGAGAPESVVGTATSRRVRPGATPGPWLEERDRAVDRRVLDAIIDLTALRHPTAVLHALLNAARDVTDAQSAAVRMPNATDPDRVDLLGDEASLGETVFAMLRDEDPADAAGAAVGLGETRTLRIAAPGRHRAGHPPGAGLHSLVGVPLKLGGQVGTLYVVNRRGRPGFTDRDVAVVTRLAAQAEVSFENALVHQRALALACELGQANAVLQAALTAKSRFLANVAHELRTPLHAILVAAQLLRDPSLVARDSRRARHLPVTIEASGRHLLGLIDDVDDLSRTETGDLGLRPVEMDLLPLLADVRRQVDPLARERRIRLMVAGGAGARVTADPLRLRQVLLNLLANAIKYTPPGGRVRLAAAVEAGTLRVSVHDTGVGIAPEDIERVFLPFERLARDGSPGAGLGLTIARRIAELHGGTLRATSAPGIGSTFTLRMPARDLAPVGSVPSPAVTAMG